MSAGGSGCELGAAVIDCQVVAGTPRVVVGGNFATPWRALVVLDGTLARYRLFALNAQAGMPCREGVTLESPFIGPGMRGRSRLRYFPCRLSLVPALLSGALPRTWCWCRRQCRHTAPCRSGPR